MNFPSSYLFLLLARISLPLVRMKRSMSETLVSVRSEYLALSQTNVVNLITCAFAIHFMPLLRTVSKGRKDNTTRLFCREELAILLS